MTKTLSIKDVRTAYVEDSIASAYTPPTDASVKAAGDAFDSWIAALKADIRRETLDEAMELLDIKSKKAYQ
jgi:hypothetical protein